MTISAQKGIFSFGLQSAKSTENVLDSDHVEAAFNVFGQTLPFAVPAPANPDVDSRLSFTVTTALGAGDVTFIVQGSLAGEGVFDVVNIPANAPVGTRVFTSGVYDTITSIELVEQSAAGQVEIGAYDSATGSASTFYRHLASDINFGPVQDLRTFPLEVGGILVPTGGYKGGVFVGGGATIQPRMEGDFGWLLKALMGNVVTTANTPEAGAHTHKFKFAADSAELPWCEVRKHIPGPIPLGERGIDCKVTSGRFSLPQNGIVQARVDFLGREPVWDENPNAWIYADAFEDFASVPVTCTLDGAVEIPQGTELPITSLVVTMANNLTSPQQEMVIGSPYPDDFVPLSRAMTMQATLKWANPDLYQQIMTGSAAGVAWANAPFTTTFRAKVTSPHKIGSTNTFYTLIIEAAKVMWNVSGPPTLAGGDIVMLPLVGTVLEPAAGQDYATITIINGQASY